ncbi:DUF3592 domain-containing protein [Flavobacterium sp. N2270]|uniref:DUF3592 domain-containing protein n=1 Tax=Flavobacterium sp. N2270 TaxID=2986831 RepID=UPI0022258731|nr:DUF3592 domain-containing protein [Flavobacterium sp. N2270]
MKYLLFFVLFLTSISSFSQEDWVKTEGTITEITIHSGRKTRETAVVKFNLEDGTEQLGNVELFRIPFIGSMKSVGDTVAVNYNKKNPVLLETVFGKFLSSYGMYILIFLGIIFSIKPFLTKKAQSADK